MKKLQGHGPDPQDPADDGEGINGVGFSPTPAIAYARTQRWRKQLNLWKERESREARAKRGELRRRQDSGGMICAAKPNGDKDAKRARFRVI